MVRRHELLLLLILFLTACGSASSPSASTGLPAGAPGPTTSATTAPSPTDAALPPGLVMIAPGVWAGNRADLLPLPTTGYSLYLVGEFHGRAETHLLLLDCLRRLHESVGLRDLAPEFSPRYEPAVNHYVGSLSDVLPDAEYWAPAGRDLVAGQDIVYLDRRVAENTSARFGERFDRYTLFDAGIPAGDAHDGIVLFREVTPPGR